MLELLQENPPRLLLFGGKGGVGKTTCAAAASLSLASRHTGDRHLLVSTDPAHSLADSLAGSALPSNLQVVELDAKACLATFQSEHGGKLRELAARGTFLDDEDIAGLVDLSLPGLDELMAFLEISRWVREQEFDRIIVDTAPTGHTLRLLALPRLMRAWLRALDALLAKHRFMRRCFAGSCGRDELDSFLEDLAESVTRLEALLRDGERCVFVPVMLAERVVIRETLDLLGELERLRVPVGAILVNRLFPFRSCPACSNALAQQTVELQEFATELTSYSLFGALLCPEEVRGEAALRAFWGSLVPLECRLREGFWREPKLTTAISRKPLLELAAEDSAPFPSPSVRLLVFAGKGGVGKTTLACATALRVVHELENKRVLLFSTDPAHSLSACLGIPVGKAAAHVEGGLYALEIDAGAELHALKESYQDEIHGLLVRTLTSFDLPFDREVIERIMDLAPPGLDEVMAITKIMGLLETGEYDLLVLDAAPTGHLVRLLELPEVLAQWLKVFFGLLLKYHDVLRLPGFAERLVAISKSLKRLRKLLADPEQAQVCGVSILTEMALAETQDLAAACQRLGISFPVLFLNQATPRRKCPLCDELYQRESRLRASFRSSFPDKQQTLVFRLQRPQGLEELDALGHALFHSVPAVRGEEVVYA